MKDYIHIITLIMSVVIAMSSGCSAFESSCTKALPTIQSTHVLLADAMIAVDEARTYVSRLPEGIREKALAAVEHADTALRSASAALVTASQACQARDVRDVFAVFASAWEAVKPFIILLGGSGGQAVEDPIVVGMMRGPS